MNLLESNYPVTLSEKGKVIVSIPDFTIKNKDILNDNISNKDIKTIDIIDKEFENDNEVIDKKCSCYTCKTNYTKAYLNHLFKCNELNGIILVQIHNMFYIEKLVRNFNKISEEDRLQAFINYLNTKCCSRKTEGS